MNGTTKVSAGEIVSDMYKKVPTIVETMVGMYKGGTKGGYETVK